MLRPHCKRNGFDDRADSLQRTEGKRVLRIYRRPGHCSCNRTRTEKERDRIDADRFISSYSSDNKLATWSQSGKQWRHGFAVCSGCEDQPGTAKGLKCGNRVLG
ncbi:MAG: hypothetical protein DME22_25045, partial [Verrucomicrobia bacterium]